MTIIFDDHIKLEITSAKFAAPLFHVLDNNRAHLSVFLPWVGNMQSAEDMKNYLQDCEKLYEEKKEISFIILDNEVPVGRIGLHYINLQNRSGAIGYWLAKNAEGKGIITKACTKLIDHAFEQMNLNRIEIKTSVANTRSKAIPEKLGFTKEGILRGAEFVNDEFIDLFLYSMLQSEWK